MARLTWMDDVAKEAGRRLGVAVRVQSNFETAGKATMAEKPLLVLQHHIGGMGIGTVVNGRSDLPPPLAHDCPRYDGSIDVIASGKANHAGKGSYRGITSSTQVVGLENEHKGDGKQPWPEVMHTTIIVLTALILLRIERGAEWTGAHKEWAPGRKRDPRGGFWDDMRQFRADVGHEMNVPPVRDPAWRDERWYTLIVFAKQATQDEYSGFAAYQRAPGGVFTLNPSQATDGVKRGEIVVVVGWPAANEIFGSKLPAGAGVHVIDGKHIAVVGNGAEDTKRLVLELAGKGWKV